ncbi:PEP-CTERM sorting domain-containing protein [Planctomycetota bacterium]|nr:PEP-CTERM sorting domain-containing protein [Planctomycetota bacterium]
MNLFKPFFAFTLAILSFTATSTAATVILDPNTPNLAIAVEGIVVDNITYTATFITEPASFYDIYDPNQDNDFSDSTTGAAPAFWDSTQNANSARDQLIAALGNNLLISSNSMSDLALIASQGSIPNNFRSHSDGSPAPSQDWSSGHPSLSKTHVYGENSLSQYHWAIFTPTNIPEPTSLALLSLTTLPLIIRRKRKAS